MAHDVLGITAHQQPPETAPPVRAAYDEVGGPVIRLGDYDLRRVLAECFDQSVVDFHGGLARRGLCLMDDRLARAAQVAEAFLDDVGRALRDPRNAVDDVNDSDAGG